MKLKTYILSLTALLCVSCGDYFSSMDIKNEYSPSIETVMSDASQYPSLLSGICVSYWASLLGWENEAMWCLGSNADQYTPGAGNFNFKTWYYYSGLEKAEIPNTVESATFPKALWYDFYGMINILKDVLKAIENGAVYTEGGQDANYKILANAYFLMGINYSEMSLLFDKCFIINESTVIEELTGEDMAESEKIRDLAISYLDKCIAICNEKGNFENLGKMFPNNTISTGDKLKGLANFMAARTLAYYPRTKGDYSKVDWSKVANYAKNGLSEDIVATLPNPDYEQWTLCQNTHKSSGWARVGLRVLKMMCPEDENAVWPLPLDFDSTKQLPEFISPDNRLKTDMEYIFEQGGAAGTSFSGYSNYSNYTYNRYCDYAESGAGDEFLFAKVESDLIYAEALANTGNTAEAAKIIDNTRVGRGQLPSIASASKDEMIKAVFYEKFVECNFIYPATSFYDRRRTPVDEFQLTTRSFRQLPVPCYELNTYGLPLYTFGGEPDANPQYKF